VSPYWVLPVYVKLIQAVWADDWNQGVYIIRRDSLLHREELILTPPGGVTRGFMGPLGGFWPKTRQEACDRLETTVMRPSGTRENKQTRRDFNVGFLFHVAHRKYLPLDGARIR
jgi:hypothetical protein